MINCIFCKSEFIYKDLGCIACPNNDIHRITHNRSTWGWNDTVTDSTDSTDNISIVKNNYQLIVEFKFSRTSLFYRNSIKDPCGKIVIQLNQLIIPKNEFDLDTKIKMLLTFM